MSWLLLFFGIVLEVCGTTCMKFSNGFTRIAPSVAMILFYMSSLGMLTLALKHIPLNVAYAIWSGLGTLLVVVIAAMISLVYEVFNEEHGDPSRPVWLSLVGIVGGIIAGALLVLVLRSRNVPLFDAEVVTPRSVVVKQPSAVEPAPKGPVPRWGRQ